MRYVRLQMFNGHFHLCSGELKHLQVMRKKFPLAFQALYKNKIFDVTIESTGALSKVDPIGIPVPGSSCFWIPLFDKNRMEWAIEKLTELGAAAIVLYHSDHCTYSAKQIEKFSRKERLDRFEKKIWAAAQQSGNFTPPNILGVYSILELQKDHFSDRTVAWTVDSNEIIQPDDMLCLSNSSEPFEIRGLLDDRLTHFVIGPEGDFSKNEMKALNNIKWGCMHRSTILRSETALIAVAAQLSNKWLPSFYSIAKGSNE
tara:strand:+ start:2240 stop:3013 length:774 start_codon:yes stop_codon:yes gene_type:complete